MSSAPAKFHFDLDLSGSARQTRVMTEARIAKLQEEARALGFAEGLAEGERSEIARSNAALAAAGQKLANDAVAMLRTVTTNDRKSLTEGVELARAIGIKLAARLLAREPEAELDTLIAECLATLERAPHLVIRCHPDLTDRLQEITKKHMAAAGYDGRLIVMGDPEIPPGDGRIEWADGGLVRNMGVILAEIDKAIASYCSGAGLPEPELADVTTTETDHGRE